MRVRCLLCRQVISYGPGETTLLLDHVRAKHPNIQIVRLADDEQKPNMSNDPMKTHSPSEMSIKHETSKEMVPCQPTELPKNVCVKKEVQDPDNGFDERSNQSKPRPMPGPMSSEPLQMDASPSVESKPSFFRYLSAAKKSIADRRRIYERKTMPVDPLMPTRRHRRRYETSIEKWKPGASKITCPTCGATRRPTIRRTASRASGNPFGAAFMLTFWPLCFMPCMFPAPTQELLHCSACGERLGEYERRNGGVIASSMPPAKSTVHRDEIFEDLADRNEAVGNGGNMPKIGLLQPKTERRSFE